MKIAKSFVASILSFALIFISICVIKLKLRHNTLSYDKYGKSRTYRRRAAIRKRGTMNNEQGCGKWIPCPICNGKTRTKVYADTVLLNFPLYCPKCRKETRIDVIQLKITLSKEPDA